jgi:hypothetical protein
MFSRVGGWHLRKVALVLLAGCLVSFAAGQVAGHYALPAPPLASLAARADAPNAAALGGALSKIQRPTVRQPVSHKPTSKPATTNKAHPQTTATKADHPHEKDKPEHKPKPKHRGHRDHHDKHGHSGGKDGAGKLLSDGRPVEQPAAQAISTDSPEGEGEGDMAGTSGPERLPPASTSGD